MTERELIEQQRSDGYHYLMQVGLFWHAYEEGAFALARMTGYNVRRVGRRGNAVVHLLGFPVDSMERVREILHEHNIRLDMVEGSTQLLRFKGGDGSFDAAMVRETKTAKTERRHNNTIHSKEGMEDDVPKCSLGEQLTEAVRDFDLLNATPVDTFMFVTHLKRLVSAAAMVAALCLCSIPAMAQSGLDSLGYGGSLGGDPGTSGLDTLGYGGSLGGDPETGGTAVGQVVIDRSVSDTDKNSHAEYFSLSGQRIRQPRRGEVYIIRWRELDVWRTRKLTAR